MVNGSKKKQFLKTVCFLKLNTISLAIQMMTVKTYWWWHVSNFDC
jgi:hypothetical protein